MCAWEPPWIAVAVVCEPSRMVSPCTPRSCEYRMSLVMYKQFNTFHDLCLTSLLLSLSLSISLSVCLTVCLSISCLSVCLSVDQCTVLWQSCFILINVQLSYRNVVLSVYSSLVMTVENNESTSGCLRGQIVRSGSHHNAWNRRVLDSGGSLAGGRTFDLVGLLVNPA